MKTVGISRGGEPANGLYHWRWPRLLNVDELKRLGSFPDGYHFAQTGDAIDDFQMVWAEIGNSVPPLMARAVGLHVRSTILGSGGR